MAANIWNSLAGYVIINIEGAYPERLINHITKSGIEIWDLKRQGTGIRLSVGVGGFYRLRTIAREYPCRIRILEKHGLTGSEVPLEEVLHLKTGVNYLENGNMLVAGEFVNKPDFVKYNRVEIPVEEAYAANCIWVNGTVIVPEGYPSVEKAVRDLGYPVILVDTSEYRKIDGGLSCLSLRF